MKIFGYKYDTEDSANLAVKQCNDYYGYPKEGCFTNRICDYYFYEKGNFYYIEYEYSVKVVLGEPEEFDIEFNIEF
jgi:hypothetical protein